MNFLQYKLKPSRTVGTLFSKDSYPYFIRIIRVHNLLARVAVSGPNRPDDQLNTTETWRECDVIGRRTVGWGSQTDLVKDVEVNGDEKHVVEEEDAREVEWFFIAHDPRSNAHDEDVTSRHYERRRATVHQEPVLDAWVYKRTHDTIITGAP